MEAPRSASPDIVPLFDAIIADMEIVALALFPAPAIEAPRSASPDIVPLIDAIIADMEIVALALFPAPAIAAPRSASPDIVPLSVQHFIGDFNRTCPHCSAKFFPSENFTCCANGAVVLPPWRVPPEPLLSLLAREEFRHHIRAYNTRMSLGSSVFSEQTVRFGPATFKMASRSWRLLPHAMHPSDSELHKCAQIYTLPAMEATDRRMSIQNPGHSPLRATWLLQLHSMLLQHNALVRSFAHSVSTVRDWHINIGSLEPHAVAHNDTMVGLLLNGGQDRQTVVIPQNGSGSLVIVPDLDPYYQPLHFVLLFPYGDPQWGLHLLRAKDNLRKRAREGVFVLRTMLVILQHYHHHLSLLRLSYHRNLLHHHHHDHHHDQVLGRHFRFRTISNIACSAEMARCLFIVLIGYLKNGL
jgi:hypothetical protein